MLLENVGNLNTFVSILKQLHESYAIKINGRYDKHKYTINQLFSTLFWFDINTAFSINHSEIRGESTRLFCFFLIFWWSINEVAHQKLC